MTRSPIWRQEAQGCWSRRLLPAGLLWVTALGCSDSIERDWLLPTAGEIYPEAAVVDSTWIALPIREYGTLSGALAFGLPYALGVLPDGELVVADAGDCSLKVIDRPSGQLLDQWGRCGDGPGEFRLLRALSVQGDSLFIYDQGRSEIVVWSSAGVEGRRMPVRGLKPGPFTLSHLDVVDDSTLVVSTEAPGHTNVTLMDRRTGELREELVGPPPIATRSDTWIRRMGGSCVQPGEAEAPIIVAMNGWAMEGLGLGVETGAKHFHFFTDLNLPPRLRSDGVWVPGPWSVNLRCGGSLFLGRVTTLEPADRDGDIASVRAASVILEARGYDGSLLMRWWVDNKDSLLRGVPGAFKGDTLFVISTKVRPYPIVGEIVFKPGPTVARGQRQRKTNEYGKRLLPYRAGFHHRIGASVGSSPASVRHTESAISFCRDEHVPGESLDRMLCVLHQRKWIPVSRGSKGRSQLL